MLRIDQKYEVVLKQIKGERPEPNIHSEEMTGAKGRAGMRGRWEREQEGPGARTGVGSA